MSTHEPGPDEREDLYADQYEDPIVDPAAAEAGESAVEPSPHQRILRALLKPGRGQVSAAVLLVILGVAGVTQVRIAGSGDEYAGMRQADLIQALNGLQAASRRNEQDIRDLETTRDALRDNNDKTAAALEQARNEIGALGVLAGTLPATGPGVRITVTVPESEISLNYLLDGIEELRDAGAEVIAINGVARVVAQSYFLDDEDQIRVGGREIKRPYRIEAIGDAQSLAQAVGFPGGLIAGIEIRGARAFVTEQDKVTITALADVKSPEYARPTS